ncbi:hypothetical protein BD309DRAFT_876086 [Dichomitus squalens]|uniref:Uncharacterized protein n=1 Tax=Dichomitus squalens TaxID=114155 RepID=A0A4Q9PXX3_9APHY|nr:hypothetical protein BD309DRAFT_876086 [Dichomitus squalens]TBU59465.1 hypothetical protein BD310DRAFT_817302 [Dichomitus squalens]
MIDLLRISGRLGSGTEVEPRGARWTSEILNREDGPIATFIFRYRPLGLLQAQGIAPLPEQPVESSKRLRQADSPLPGPPTQAKCPRTGSPIPVMTGNADVKPDISELSDGDDDLDALNTQLSQIQDRINRAKAKKGRSSPAATKVKKEEPKTSARDALDGDVIDLTMSD